MAPADPAPSPIRSLGTAFSVGRVVNDTLTTWLRNAPAFAVVSAVCEVPVFLVMRYVPLPVGEPTFGLVAASIALLVFQFTAWNLSLAAVTLGVVESRQGQRPTIRRCLRVTIRALPTLFGITLRTIARFLPPLFVAGFVFGVLSASGCFADFSPGRASVEDAWMDGLFGAAALWSLARVGIAGPAAVVEGIRSRDAMARSRSLTKGRRWEVGAALFLLGGVPLAVSDWLGTRELDDTGAWYASATWWWARTVLGWIVVSPLIATLVATIYHALRRERDGVDSDVLADVFA